MKKLLVFAALLLGTFMGCQKDELTPIQITENKLIGKWDQIAKGEIHPIGSQEIKNANSDFKYEFKKDKVLITIFQGESPTEYHWEMVDANTIKNVEFFESSGKTYKIIELDDNKLTFSFPSIKNINGANVEGETIFYFTRN